jgi:hypothetical protein
MMKQRERTTTRDCRRARRLRRARGWVTGGLVTLALLGAGQSASTAWADTPTDAGPRDARVETSNDSDVTFVAVVRQRPAFAGVGEADLVQLGHLTCQALDRGATDDDLVAAGRPTFSPADMGWLMGASIVTYCPSHMDRIQAQPQGGQGAGSSSAQASPRSTGPGSTDSILRESERRMWESYRNRINP